MDRSLSLHRRKQVKKPIKEARLS
ncbi:hypothetical protein CCACVL1_29225 [Corchorus capsularis]|uniref:Uncharacterized protein n=1 Tax=Corchorus capsularis TaxID=210143 RepID=A0A1R3G2W6_COCAP|nr:hypothetical protein CCACVL1_29225 [Corchorus capsularis]